VSDTVASAWEKMSKALAPFSTFFDAAAKLGDTAWNALVKIFSGKNPLQTSTTTGDGELSFVGLDIGGFAKGQVGGNVSGGISDFLVRQIEASGIKLPEALKT